MRCKETLVETNADAAETLQNASRDRRDTAEDGATEEGAESRDWRRNEVGNKSEGAWGLETGANTTAEPSISQLRGCTGRGEIHKCVPLLGIDEGTLNWDRTRGKQNNKQQRSLDQTIHIWNKWKLFYFCRRYFTCEGVLDMLEQSSQHTYSVHAKVSSAGKCQRLFRATHTG